MKTTKKTELVDNSLKSKKSLIEPADYYLNPNKFATACYSISLTSKRLIAMMIAYFNADADYENKKNRTVKITISDYFKQFNLSASNEQRLLFKNTADDFPKMHFKIMKENAENFEYITYNFFSTVKVSWGWGECVFTLTEEMANILSEYKKGYAYIELDKIKLLQSVYAIRFYEIALSYAGFAGKNGNKKGAWWFEITIAELKKIFETEKKYNGRTDNFRKKCIDLPIEEINNSNIGIRITCEYIKRSRTLYSVIFHCEHRNYIPTQEDEEYPATKEREEINFYKTKFPVEFEKYKDEYIEAKTKEPLLFEYEKKFIEMEAPFEAVRKIKHKLLTN